MQLELCYYHYFVNEFIVRSVPFFFLSLYIVLVLLKHNKKKLFLENLSKLTRFE